MEVDKDDLRHRQEQKRLKEKRHAARKSSKKAHQRAKYKEHVKHKLGGASQKQGIQKVPILTGGSSEFQSKFSQRSEGFIIDFQFRNAPPRPPVGPHFVGLDMEGFRSIWTKYRPFNAVEKTYTWKLHSEPDLGVPLAPSAMNLKMYKDPSKEDSDADDNSDKEDTTIKQNASNQKRKRNQSRLHPDDAALINWKGSMGDTCAEQLQFRRDRARAEARAIALGKELPISEAENSERKSIGSSKKIKTPLNRSRVLKEGPQSWMLKTTYITNDHTKKVHNFTTGQTIKQRMAEQVETQIKETEDKRSDPNTIENQFDKFADKNWYAKLQHPNPMKRAKKVKPLFDMPVLPDIFTWGNTYTHVVVDKPPASKSSSKNMGDLMEEAFITSVRKNENNAAKMICNMLVPVSDSSDGDTENKMDACQTYDLEVNPLKDEESPHVNFLFTIRREDQTLPKVIDDRKIFLERGVYYHPISSRVQLSSGRPIIDEANSTYVTSRNEVTEEDAKNMEMKLAEIDQDLIDKWKIPDEGDKTGRDSDDDDDDDLDNQIANNMSDDSSDED